MKTKEEWLKIMRGGAEPTPRQFAECAEIQIDAWRQGMTDAAELIQNKQTVEGAQSAIRIARDKRKVI